MAAALLFCAASMQGQVTVGDNTSMKLDGSLGFSYSGGFGDFQSGHGTAIVGDGNLSGYYYSPKFLSFNVNPYYDRSQTSSSSGFLGQDSGLGATVNLFSGSRMPGLISYGKSWGTGNSYGVPGSDGLFTSSSTGDSWQIGWGLLMPKWPSLQVNYMVNGSTSSLIGGSNDLVNKNKTLTFTSQYSIAGFSMTGDVGFNNQNVKSPSFLGPYESSGNSNFMTLQAIHPLPMNGIFSTTYNHTNSDFDGTGSGIDMFSAGVGLNPLSRLSVGANFRYTDNIYGVLLRDMYGNVPVLVAQANNSKAIAFDANASYRVTHKLSVNGYFLQREQTFNDQQATNTIYGAGATYIDTIPFLGYFRFGFTLVDFYNNVQNNTGLGSFYLNGSLNRYLGKWELSADGNYGQNVTSGSDWYTSSSFNWGGNVVRRFRPGLLAYGTYRANHSALTNVEGSNSHAQTFSGGITIGAYGASASYSNSGGTSVVGPTGLLNPTPLASVLTNNYILYNAQSLGISGSALLFRRALITGGYSNTHGDTTALVNSVNFSESYYLRLQYKVRKLAVSGMYRRIDQSISAISGIPQVANSYSIEITRWFSVF